MAIIDDRIKFINAGFDYPNPEAEVVIVGITPGKNQLENGYDSRSLKVSSKEESLNRKKMYAFKGLRKNIAKMLESVGVDKILNIESCETIWDKEFEKIDATSLIKEAAYEDINGRKVPFNDAEKIANSIRLSERFKNGFVLDCKQYSNAKLFVACGHKVYKCLSELKEKGIITVPVIAIAHPSNNNKIRVVHYQGEVEKSLIECKKDADEAKSVINDFSTSP